MIGRITPRKLNADTDERSLRADEMKHAVNVSVDADSNGDGGVVKFSDGNLSAGASDALARIESNGENTVIGSVVDEELGVVYFFVHNTLEADAIYAYSNKTNTYRLIFKHAKLNFDQNGFVKGDVVRIKRTSELEQVQVLGGQGSQGGVVFEDDGPTVGPPASELLPQKVSIRIERSLLRLLELSENSYDRASAQSEFSPSDFAVTATATKEVDTSISSELRDDEVSPFGGGIETVPVFFYNEGEDLNLGAEGQETFENFTISVQFPGVNAAASESLKSPKLVIEGDMYLRPTDANNAGLEVKCSISYESSLKLQNWKSQSFGLNDIGVPPTGREIPPGYFKENVFASGFENYEYEEPVGYVPVFTASNRSAYNMRASDVYKGDFLDYVKSLYDSPPGEEIRAEILHNQAIGAMANKKVNTETNEIESVENNGLLRERTVPVEIHVRYENTEAYQTAVDWLDFYDNANDDAPVTADDDNTAAVGGGFAGGGGAATRAAAIPSDVNISVHGLVIATCPYTFGYKGYVIEPYVAPRFNYDSSGNIVSARTNSQIRSDLTSAVQEYSGVSVQGLDVSGSSYSLGFQDGNNNYSTWGQVVQAMELYMGLPYQVTEGSLTYYNAVIINVQGGTLDTESCPSFNPAALFVPSLIVAPATSLNGEYKQYFAYNKEYPDPDSQTAIQDFVNFIEDDPVFKYRVDVPVSGVLDRGDRDVIIACLNDSEVFDTFRSIEYIPNNETYDFSIVGISGDTASPFMPQASIDEVLSESNQTFFSFTLDPNNPSNPTPVQGRRVRVNIKENPDIPAIEKTLAEVIAPKGALDLLWADTELGSPGDGIRPIRCVPKPESVNVPFCFGVATDCGDIKRQISLLGPGAQIADAPVIFEGELQEEEIVEDTSDDTSGDTSGDTTISSGTTTPEDVNIISKKTSSSATKNTIQKKY